MLLSCFCLLQEMSARDASYKKIVKIFILRGASWTTDGCALPGLLLGAPIWFARERAYVCVCQQTPACILSSARGIAHSQQAREDCCCFLGLDFLGGLRGKIPEKTIRAHSVKPSSRTKWRLRYTPPVAFRVSPPKASVAPHARHPCSTYLGSWDGGV